MARKKIIEWQNGDVFALPLLNGSFVLGQVLDLQMKTIVRVALFNETVKKISEVIIEDCCKYLNLISLAATTREQLDFNAWKIVGNKDINIRSDKFPNETFRSNGWIGAEIYDAAILEDFANSFYGLLPWDDWGNPFFLDELLIDANKKPSNLVYLKK